jgi:hypothetical protein
MKRRIAAVGKLLPWREADLTDYLAGAPLQRTWDVRVAEAEGGDVSLHEEAHMIGHYFGIDGQLHEGPPDE